MSELAHNFVKFIKSLNRKDKTMDFIEALQYAKDTGNSIVPVRYSDRSQDRVQYYYNSEGQFLVQDADKKPYFPSMDGNKYFNEEWKPYEGSYVKAKDAKQRYEELKEKYEDTFEELEEYRKLREKFKRL